VLELDHRMSERMMNGRRSCAIPAKCDLPQTGSLMEREWEEFVIRWDERANRFVTRTVCCAGAPVCC